MEKKLPAQRLRIFTWHIHGSYLFYLSQGDYDIYIPVTEKRTEEGYYGRGQTFPFGLNVIEVPAAEVRNMEFDCILFQTNQNFLKDQYDILSEEQRQLPRLYVEHDPPTKNPTEQAHVMSDPDVLMIHVTHFNRLMWDNEGVTTRVIEHGVVVPDIPYTGEKEKGLVVINHLHQRGRKLGADIFERVSQHIPLDLAGMGTKEYGGLGEVLHPQLPEFATKYRFFFNPIRYTSMGLAVCEAMMLGIPMVALATTEYTMAINDGVSGFIHADVDYLIEKMKLLLDNPALAIQIGQAGRKTALEKYGITRFAAQWKQAFQDVITGQAFTHKSIMPVMSGGITTV
jgi:glycosyltransferase involved in cell wall biosynthesis